MEVDGCGEGGRSRTPSSTAGELSLLGRSCGHDRHCGSFLHAARERAVLRQKWAVRWSYAGVDFLVVSRC